MGIGVPLGAGCGPDTRLQSLGANPSAIGLDFAPFPLDTREEVELVVVEGEVKHLPPPGPYEPTEEEVARHHNQGDSQRQ